MTSKCLPEASPGMLFQQLCRKRHTFMKPYYLLCKSHIWRVPGPLFYVPFLENCRPGAYKNPHLQKNSKKGAPGRPRERQRVPVVSQSDPNWVQNGTPNDLKIHSLSRCLPRGGPNVTFTCLGVPPCSKKYLFGCISSF